MNKNSALLPNAMRIHWHDATGEYHSETFTDFEAADKLFQELRGQNLQVGQKPIYNYKAD